MIEMINVSVHYSMRGQTIKALDDIDIKIQIGEFLTIVGPSGSGKSTLIQVLGGMLAPGSGEVVFDSLSLYNQSSDQRAAFRKLNIGFVFQTFNLIPYLTAKQNVQIPLLLNGKSKENQVETASDLLTRLGLSDRMEHKPSELSVGQQQRVALARMLSNNPQVIIADEPTGALDPETSQNILDFLAELNEEGRTIVMVTHDHNAAQKGSRSIYLRDGKMLTN